MSRELVQKSQEQKLALFTKALKKAEANMMALSILIDHFKEQGYDRGQYAPQFESMMGNFAKLLREFSRTEYEYEGPYSSDQTLERYRNSVSKSWKHKPEKAENSDVSITEEEIKEAMRKRMESMENLQARRQQQGLLEGKPQSRPMITGPDGKSRYDFEADAESSDEEDEEVIRRVLSGDQNPGKNDTAKLKAAHLARLKSESAPISQRLEDLSISQKRDMNIVKQLKARGGDSYQNYSLEELEDVHSMQKGFLGELGSEDEEENMSESFRARQAKTRGQNAVDRTTQEMARRKAAQDARDKKNAEKKKSAYDDDDY